MSPSALLSGVYEGSSSVAVYPEQSEGESSGFCTKLSILIISSFIFHFSFAQRVSLSDSSGTVLVTDTNKSPVILPDLGSIPHYTHNLSQRLQKKRQWFTTGIHAIGYGSSLIILNNAWYKDYAKTSFHTFSDSKEWLQMDKVGHAWAAYNAGKASSAMWQWAGLPHKKAIWIGSLSSTAYLTAIEFLDAHSAKWGWSWSDIGANLIGSGFFMGQEFLWKEQRIQFKFSFHKKNYSESILEQRGDDLFGKNWYERMLKDYNAQTYWLGINLKSFLPKSKLPAWLNVAVGYGADGMYGGFDNKWIDQSGNEVTRFDIPRKRQFYLAPDIDFTKIKTNKKWVKTVFTFLNAFKCPAPALMMDSKGKLKAYAIYF
jgi:hypothetical protein